MNALAPDKIAHRARYPDFHQHLFHQGAAFANHCRLAPGLHLLRLGAQEEVTVWVALTEASEAAGYMDALSFRGKPRQLSHVSRVVKDSVNRVSQAITEPLDEGLSVPMPLKPGWFSMHHGLCPHRSGPNTSNRRRIGLGLNYIPTNVKPCGSIRQAAMLVRGVDRDYHFEDVAWPKAELDSEAIAARERAMSLYRDAYLEEEARYAKSQVARTAQGQHGSLSTDR